MKFDEDKNEVHVSETMYKFVGVKDNSALPFDDPNEDFLDELDGVRRTSNRNKVTWDKY